MKILNIHGYKGNAENSAYFALKELGHDVISPQLDYDAESPENILSSLSAVLSDSKPDVIVGTSLGGFFALLLSIESGLPSVLVNPCLMPFVTLPQLGYGGDISGFIRLFGRFSELGKSSVFAVIGGRDEVISYHDLTKRLIREHIVIPNGKHSGATLPLKEIFGEVIK